MAAMTTFEAFLSNILRPMVAGMLFFLGSYTLYGTVTHKQDILQYKVIYSVEKQVFVPAKPSQPEKKSQQMSIKDSKAITKTRFAGADRNGLSDGHYQFQTKDGTIYSVAFCKNSSGDYPELPQNGYFSEIVFWEFESHGPEDCDLFASARQDWGAKW